MSTTASYYGIVLQKVLCHEIMAQAVHDGPNYLYSRKLLALRGVLSPSETSYRRLQGGNVVYDAGRMGASTLADIEHQLLQPRGPFVLRIGATPVVVAPETGQSCDANNGPFVHHCRVLEVFGSRTVLVEMVIEVCTNDCPDTKKRVVLSNVFSMQEDVSLPGYFSVRSVHGRCVLHAGRARANDLVPDDFRSSLLHPRPVGYQRQDIQVRAAEDGTHLSYSFVDKELPINYGVELVRRGGVSDIQAVHHVVTERHDAAQVFAEAGYSVMQAAGLAVRSTAFGAGGGLIGLGWGILRGATVTAVGAAAGALTYLHLVPRNRHTVTVRVQGNKNASRSLLYRTAVSVAFAKMRRFNTFGSAWGAMGVSTAADLMDKFVEFQISWTTGLDALLDEVPQRILQGNWDEGILGSVIQAGSNAASALRTIRLDVDQNENLSIDSNVAPGGIQSLGFINVLPPVPNNVGPQPDRLDVFQGQLLSDSASERGWAPSPPWDAGTRSRVERVFAQALQDECALPQSGTQATREQYGRDFDDIDSEVLQ